MKITNGLIEQHLHGAFGTDFMKSDLNDILNLTEELSQNGVSSFFPTIMTDNLEVIKERINIIKEAKRKQKKHSAQIEGIHLEGPFINPQKNGIHEKNYILPLYVELFDAIYDDIIKIVTIAPELDDNYEFQKYLNKKNIKISLGHSTGTDFKYINQVTHLYNAMGAFSQRGESTVVKALVNKEIYTELIADSLHVSDDVLKITFKQRPIEKILLISDALPMAHSNNKEQEFAGQIIYNNRGKLINKDGVIAGSSMLLCDIVKNLADKKLLKFDDIIQCSSANQMAYHNITNNLKVFWDEENNINKVEFIN